MNPLIKTLANSSNYTTLVKQIVKKSDEKLSIVGLTDSSKAWMLYGITQNTNKSSIIVCSNVFQANKIIQDLKFYANGIEVVFLPPRALQYYDIEAESKEISNQRMYAIERILSGKRLIAVTTIDALLVQMFPNTKYKGEEFSIKSGDSISMNKLVEKLSKFGFERTENVEGKGQFALRGGIVDLFCINNDLPFRIEFFGEEVDSIRTFDPITQRSIDTVKKIDMSQVSENYVTLDKINAVISELKTFLRQDNINEELKQNIESDIEKIREGSLDNLIDKYFNLPKYDHYDPIIKSIAINNAFNTSQAQSARDISSITNGLSYFIDKEKVFNIPRQSIYNWIKNNWRTSGKEPVKNKEIWQELYGLTKIHKVKFIKVKGHSDNEYNNRCDELARNAIKAL